MALISQHLFAHSRALAANDLARPFELFCMACFSQKLALIKLVFESFAIRSCPAIPSLHSFYGF